MQNVLKGELQIILDYSKDVVNDHIPIGNLVEIRY